MNYTETMGEDEKESNSQLLGEGQSNVWSGP